MPCKKKEIKEEIKTEKKGKKEKKEKDEVKMTPQAEIIDWTRW